MLNHLKHSVQITIIYRDTSFNYLLVEKVTNEDSTSDSGSDA